MKTWILAILLTLSVGLIYGQTDTVYIKYEKAEFNSKSLDTYIFNKDASKPFPFDTGRHYHYNKKDGNFTDFYSFSYNSKIPEWSSQPFRYMQVTKKELKKLKFIDNEWFVNHSYDEILSYFSDINKVIYLYDTHEPRGKKIYLVKVYDLFVLEE